MTTSPYTWFFIVSAAFLTLTVLLYGQYFNLDYMFSDPRVLRPRPLMLTAGNITLYKEHETKSTNKEEKGSFCSLRWRVEEDAFLRRRFNFSVPVLQWAGSFNPSDWLRLQHSLPPYGWKGLPLNVLNSTLGLLNDSLGGQLFEQGSRGRCVRCAVVGNGGILNGSKQGRAIDGHHFIFRVNGAVTKGFEEDVGTKTSFYGFTANTMKNSLISYGAVGFNKVPQGQGVGYIFIPSNIRDYMMLAAGIKGTPVASGVDRGDEPSKYFGPKSEAHQFKMLHPDFITYIKERFLKSPILRMLYSHLYMPSTGALMLLTAVHTCDQVSAYGFITENYKDFSDHYFDAEKQPLVFYANHDMQMEARLWDQLHAKKVLWLYKRAAEK